jgi:predicted aldo/keto reductase-like oxidoreductase
MGPDGALKAAVEARDQGLVKNIGVTGHGYTVAAMHKQSLEQFEFDSVLLPYNYIMMQNPEYTADFESLLELCKERRVAVQTIKSLARRPWGDKERIRSTWYEPLEDQADIDRAVHWVLEREGIFLNTSSDIHILPNILDAATRFETGPPEEEMQEKASKLGMKPIFDGRSLVL